MKFENIPNKDFYDALLSELIYIAEEIKGNPSSYYRLILLHDRLAHIAQKPHAVKLKGARDDR